MAITSVVPVKVPNFNVASGNVAYSTATTPADGFSLDFTGKDYKILILVTSTAAGGTVTFKAGDGIQGVADYTTPAIAANNTIGVVLESGAFMHMTGANKGKVIIVPSAATVTIAAVELP